MNQKLFIAAPVVLLVLIVSVIMVRADSKPASPASAPNAEQPQKQSPPQGFIQEEEQAVVLGSPLVPVNSTFTYHGRLPNGPQHQNGEHDFRLTLYDALTGGNRIAGPVVLTYQTVDDGNFTLLVDFGPSPFQGEARYMEIAEKRSGHNEDYRVLSPRATLAPVPYALSLMPGAVISSTIASPGSILNIYNGGSGNGLYSSSYGGRGVYGNSTTGTGVYGVSTSSNGVSGRSNGMGAGVYGSGYYGGKFISSNGMGVFAQSSTDDAVHGLVMTGTAGSGVAGIHNGGGYGVSGSSARGVGVYGTSTDHAGVHGSSDTNYGVWGQSGSGPGVYGNSNSGPGIYGFSADGPAGYFSSTIGIGLWGESEAGDGVHGVANGGEDGDEGYGVAGYHTGSSTGVYGSSVNGDGVTGESDNGTGVSGYSQEGDGISGHSDGSGAIGVYGENTDNGTGVIGVASGDESIGVLGTSDTGIGVQGQSAEGLAGNFIGDIEASGDVTVTGDLTVTGELYVHHNIEAGASAFKIDDPLDPANKLLSHYTIASPEMKNIYDGVVMLDSKGEAWVQMPNWFEGLNQDFRYQLTPIGTSGPSLYIAQKIKHNQFKIAGGIPSMEVSWQVTGIRHDPYAVQHQVPVEQDKSAKKRGSYLHPELYRQSFTKP